MAERLLQLALLELIKLQVLAQNLIFQDHLVRSRILVPPQFLLEPVGRPTVPPSEMPVHLLVKEPLHDSSEAPLRLLAVVSEGAPGFKLLIKRPLLEAPEQLVDPDVLNIDSAHKVHVVLVLVKELLDHVLPQARQDHPCSVLLPSLHLHPRKPPGPSDAELPRRELFDGRGHLLPLVRSEGGRRVPQLLVVRHDLSVDLVVLALHLAYDPASLAPQRSVLERLPIDEVGRHIRLVVPDYSVVELGDQVGLVAVVHDPPLFEVAEEGFGEHRGDGREGLLAVSPLQLG